MSVPEINTSKTFTDEGVVLFASVGLIWLDICRVLAAHYYLSVAAHSLANSIRMYNLYPKQNKDTRAI